MNIENKTIIITGAARGLGYAMAGHLASLGAQIALLDLESDTLKSSCQSITEAGGKAKAFSCDVSKEDSVKTTIQQVFDSFGPVCGLVNNAGILRDGLLVKARDGKVIETLSYDKWQSVINVNLTGVFLCGREVASHLIEQGFRRWPLSTLPVFPGQVILGRVIMLPQRQEWLP